MDNDLKETLNAISTIDALAEDHDCQKYKTIIQVAIDRLKYLSKILSDSNLPRDNIDKLIEDLTEVIEKDGNIKIDGFPFPICRLCQIKKQTAKILCKYEE